MVSKPNVSIPHSNFKFELAKLFKDEGYVSDVKVSGEGVKKLIDIEMKYSEEGVSVISGMALSFASARAENFCRRL